VLTAFEVALRGFVTLSEIDVFPNLVIGELLNLSGGRNPIKLR